MAEFGRVKTNCGMAVLRDLRAEDIPAIVEYWTKSSNEFLTFMGVDRERLGSEADITKRLSTAIRSDDAEQSSIGLAIALDDGLAGYTRRGDSVTVRSLWIPIPISGDHK